MTSIEQVREKTKHIVIERLTTIPTVCSITFVGSFLHSNDISVISDIDIIVIIEELTEDIFTDIREKATAITGTECGLEGYQVKLNMSFGPLKFNDPKTMVFHLMVYDIAGHRKHVIASPFTCNDWESNPAVFGKDLAAIYSATPLQLDDITGTRRGLHSYLDDLNKGSITYRYYDFTNGIVSEKRETHPMDDRHKKEYGYHIMKYLMLNLLKILQQKNLRLSDNELAIEFNTLGSMFDEHIAFFRAISDWKKSGAAEPGNIREELEKFIDTLETWLEERKKNMPAVVFYRHAKTNMNDGSFLGIGRDPDIDKATVEVPVPTAYNTMFSGTLKRTIQTAQLFTTPVQKQDALLNEINYGEAEGLFIQDFYNKFPGIVEAWKKNQDPAFPGGESQGDVAARFDTFIAKELFSLVDGVVAGVVTHNIVMRVILGRFFAAPVHAWYRLLPSHLEPVSCRIYNNTLIPALTAEQRVKFQDQLVIWQKS